MRTHGFIGRVGVLLIGSILLGVWGIGCGSDPHAKSEGNFIQAINANLKMHNPAVLPFGARFPYTYTSEAAWGVKKKELDALVQAGLLSSHPTTTERYVGYNLPKAEQPAVEYALTAEGAKRYVNYGFIFSDTEVARIENFADRSMFGLKAVEVKFTPKFTHIAPWAADSQIQAALPALTTILKRNDNPAPQTIVLQDTNTGWSTSL